LRAPSRAVCTASGSAEREATLVADHLVEANLGAIPTASRWTSAPGRRSWTLSGASDWSTGRSMS
jgi:hypothetical protein